MALIKKLWSIFYSRCIALMYIYYKLLLKTAIILLNKLLRCRCKPEHGQKSRRFVLLLDQFLRCLKLSSGLSCRKPRKVLKPIATVLDSLIDSCRKVKNPFYFYHPEEPSFSDNINTILGLCRIERPLPYCAILPSWSLSKVKKIAEGSYGEIYITKNFDGTERVLKTVTVYGENREFPDMVINSDETVVEAVCSKYLSKLKDESIFQAANFPTLYNIDMAYGKPPKRLVEAWKAHKQTAEEASDDIVHGNPDRYASDTLFTLLELEHCGTPILLQTASALAVAECAYGFEHRDLHGGNWLFKSTHHAYFIYKTDSIEWAIPTRNVQAFIIDFSLSRIEIDGLVTAREVVTVKKEENQLDDFLDHNSIYNMCEKIVGQDYKRFEPKTNLLWLKHLAENLIKKFSDEHSGTALSFTDRTVLYILKRISQLILQYSSTMNFLEGEIICSHVGVIKTT